MDMKEAIDIINGIKCASFNSRYGERWASIASMKTTWNGLLHSNFFLCKKERRYSYEHKDDEEAVKKSSNAKTMRWNRNEIK